MKTTLLVPSDFFWNSSYRRVRLGQRHGAGGELIGAERVGTVDEQRHDVRLAAQSSAWPCSFHRENAGKSDVRVGGQ
ncbi:MAG TPA: hypothetical protein VFD59_07455 [Nocardioidaceae bacterium]|nr:hypothetical protein [Nocardioidaceae bacterium]